MAMNKNEISYRILRSHGVVGWSDGRLSGRKRGIVNERVIRHGTDAVMLTCELLTRELVSRGANIDDMDTVAEQMAEICPVFAKLFRDFYHDYIPAYEAARIEFKIAR